MRRCPLYCQDGKWYTGEHMGDIESYKDMNACLKTAVRVVPASGENGGADLLRWPPKRFGSHVAGGFDVALPVVHGTNVEDGALSGFLRRWRPLRGLRCDRLRPGHG